jgi:hypothetical protein
MKYYCTTCWKCFDKNEGCDCGGAIASCSQLIKCDLLPSNHDCSQCDQKFVCWTKDKDDIILAGKDGTIVFLRHEQKS